jgi:hypothetical protein
MSKSSLRENAYWDEKAENFGVHDVFGKTEVCTGHVFWVMYSMLFWWRTVPLSRSLQF